jgi:drug/metabolite transporter (DMT)-like permease
VAVLHLVALAGVLSISFSAVFVRLAAVSPVTAGFYRVAFAVPVLAAVWAPLRRRDSRPLNARALAFASGLFLAVDLALWHESIALIGVGLATVLPNVQVIFVALGAAFLYRERLSRRLLVTIVAMLAGIAMTSGLSRADAFGHSPVAGVVFGALAGVAYSVFLLMFRASNRMLVPTAGPLLDSTLGVVVGSLLCAPFDPAFSFHVSRTAFGWLVLLALVAQVIGWLCIATALPRLRATETSVLLLVQPVFALVWGVVLFAEHLSPVQWAGAALVLAGLSAATGRP